MVSSLEELELLVLKIYYTSELSWSVCWKFLCLEPKILIEEIQDTVLKYVFSNKVLLIQLITQASLCPGKTFLYLGLPGNVDCFPGNEDPRACEVSSKRALGSILPSSPNEMKVSVVIVRVG